MTFFGPRHRLTQIICSPAPFISVRIKSSLLALAAFLLTAVATFATIDATLQMQTGNPSSATADTTNHTHYLINRAQYALEYNDTTREPNWVAWDLTAGDVGGSGRSNFIVDTNLPAGFYQVLTTDYSGSGFDRGHMCPSADRTVTAADNQIVFYMSNMIPQAPDNNQGVWASFETYCRSLASSGNEVLIMSGPSGFAGSTIASGVAIPGYTWKIAVVVPTGSGTALSRIDANTRVIAIKIPNIAGVRSDPWQKYITSASVIQTDTGYTFFTAPSLAGVAATLRAKVDGQTATGSPTITTPPTAQTAAVGGTATFSVVATGNAPLTYQWLKDDNEIADATNASFTLTNVQASDAANYTVVVTNAVGSVTSSAAALVITGLPPTIVTPPVARTVGAGTTVTFSVTASGSPTLTYQWRKATVNLTNTGNASGVTTPTLTLTNVQSSDIASYDVVVTNTSGSATSTAATLTVTPAAPSIATQPSPATVTVGGTATFTVVATGTAPLSYVWRKAGTAISGNTSAATATLTLTNAQAADAANYDVVVSNGIGSAATSNAAALTVTTVTSSQLAYNGGTITQTFDTLPSSGNFTLSGAGPFALNATPISASGLAGWSIAKISGTGANELFTVGTGSANSGSVYSFGSASATDRALGTLLSGTVGSAFGLVLVNNTGQTVTQFTLSYNGEQWRYGAGTLGGTDKLSFEYQVGGSDIVTGTFTAATALDFTSRVNSATAVGTAGALDGNATANRAAISATVTGVSWANGQTLVLRWKDFDVAGSDDGLAVDDFSFTTPVSGPAVAPAVASTTPANNSTGIASNSPITVTFNQAINFTGTWFSITSAAKGALAATVTGGPTTFTFTLPVNIDAGDTITTKIFAAQVTDQATGLVHPTSDFTFSFSTATPIAPSITTPPAPQTVAAGTDVTFTVVASGSAPLAYQWRKGGTPISGNASANTATLALSNVQAADIGNYDVVVTNSVSSATSTAATLTVNPSGPTITTPPVAQTATIGGSANFSVVATGTAPLTYQWRKAGANINGNTSATTPTLSLTNIQSADGANYDVVVTNSVSSATSTPVALTVSTTLPSGQLAYGGGTYNQNFDTLPSAGTFTFSGAGPFALDAAAPNGVGASGLVGWTIVKASGTGTNALFNVGSGTSNSGSIYSFGAASATDRALGSIASGSTVSRFGLTLVNTTGVTITQFTLGYTGEQWRRGNSAANKLTFEYSVGATNLSTGTFTAATTLDFTAPAPSGTGDPVDSALDGNVAANRTVIAPVTISGLAWGPGQTLVLRWSDTNDAGNDDGIGIDDLSFTTPGSIPSITTPPVAQTVNIGTAASFSVVAVGNPVPTYQWRKGGVAISGNPSASTSTLAIATAALADAGNYDCVITNTSGSVTTTPVALVVNKLVATVALGSLTATYDGTAKAATATTVPAGLSVGFTYNTSSAAPSAAGSYAVVATINDPTYAGTTSGTLTIATAPLTVTGVTVANKVYDRTTTATPAFTGATLNGLVAGDSVNVSLVTSSVVASFADRLVAPAKPVTVSGLTVSGSAAANYAFSQPTGLTASITAKPLTVSGITAASRVYDATTAASLTTTAAALVGVVAGDTVTLDKTNVSGSFATKTAAAGKTVQVAGLALAGSDAANYALAQPTATADITAKNLTVSGLTAVTKVYDGKTTATLGFGTAALVGIAGLDTVTLVTGSATGTFADANAGINKTVQAAGLTLGANDAANYTLTQPTATASIIPATAAISIAGLSQVYDGTPKSITVTTLPTATNLVVYSNPGGVAPTDAGSYTVTVTITDNNYSGSAAGTLVIAKAAQTVTLSSPPASVVPGVAFTLAATASSGLPVTLSVVSGNATISGNSVTVADASPVTLRATQAGGTNYTAATADLTVTAGKLSQTIAFAAPADQPSSAGPLTLTATASSNLPVTFSVVSGPATVAGTTLTLTGTAGTVVIRADQAGNATYSAAASVDRTFAVTAATVAGAPRITSQPTAQVAQTGSAASFSVFATGTPAPTYQWRKDGTAIPGATGATFALTNVSAGDAASYDVVVTNSAGSVTSSLARLTVSATATAPVITRLPGNLAVVAGRSATFSVVATGAPAPTYQWSRSSTTPGVGAGILIAGATGATLTIPNVAASDAANYTVIVTNSAGAATASANLRVIARSYAGTYFGSLGNGGTFALRINDDNTGVFLGFLAGSSTAFVSRAVSVDDSGNFSFAVGSTLAPSATESPAAGRVAALSLPDASGDVVFTGTISAAGTITGTTSGATVLAISATKSADTGATSGSAGFYQAGAAGSSAQTLAIVSPSGQAFVVTQNGTTADAGTGTVDASGKVAVTTAGRATVSANVSADTTGLTATVTTASGASTTFAGYADGSAALAQQRIVNLSTRTTAGIGDQVAIVGFVVTGLESKPVLIRAVGPALRALGVTTALAAPKLDLRNTTSLLATNTGWSTAGNSTEIANAAARSGAFPLTAGSADSVILTTLAPGTYNAIISAADAKAGVGLVEVYDLSGPSTAQKLANLSTRAPIGTGEGTLISGFVVGGAAPKRVLIRAAGPSLAAFGVAGALSRPALTLFSGSTVVAQNSGWSPTPDSAAIADAATRVGAFAFAVGSADAALIVNLPPGAYTAQVSGVSGATGITLLEVYDLP